MMAYKEIRLTCGELLASVTCWALAWVTSFS